MNLRAPRRELLFDFHTMPWIKDLGSRFDFEKIAAYWKECDVDTISFPFRCNQGFSYYPTEIGYVYPSLRYDLLGRLLETAHSIGVRMMIYTNMSVFVEGWMQHPEWRIRTPDHSVYDNCICSNSGATSHICAQIEEVLSLYDVDGLFLDFGYDPPCLCDACLGKMTQEGIDWKNEPGKHFDFARRSSIAKMDAMYASCRKVKPDILFFVNGIPFEEKVKYCTHFEYECIPTSRWGYNSLALYSRYVRNFGKSVSNMTGRFHGGWGDFGGLRPEKSLEYDVFYGAANGMNTTIGDHFHPRGDLYEGVMKLVASTFRKLSAVDEWTLRAEPLADIAVIVPKNALDNTGGSLDGANGCTRMLIELKCQFDVYSDAMELRRHYELIILPDDLRMTPALEKNIRSHLAHGGKIISSFCSGLNASLQNNSKAPLHLFEEKTGKGVQEIPSVQIGPEDRFVFPEWEVILRGILEYDPAFLCPGTMGKALGDVPATAVRRGLDLSLSGHSEAGVMYVKPYFNRMDRKERFFQYIPPDVPTDKPALVFGSQVAHFAFPVFGAYFESGRLPYKALVRECIERFLPDGLVKSPDAPSYVKMTVTEQKEKGRRILHILADYPEKRTPSIEVIEDDVEIHALQVSLRTDSLKVSRIYTAPERKDCPFSPVGGYVTFTLPPFAGHTIAVVEE